MSKMLDAAKEIGANFALIVHGEKGYRRFYKKRIMGREP